MNKRTTMKLMAALVLAVCAGALAAQAVPEALYFKFNEGTGTTTANDALPGQGPSNPSFTGTPTWATSGNPLGAAGLTFGNGTSSFGMIETGNWPSTVLPATQSFTYEFWMRNSDTTAQYLLGDSAASSWRLYLLPSQGISMRGGGFSTLNSSTTAPLWNGTWEHVAFVYDAGANTCYWYINGQLDSTFTNQTSSLGSVTNFKVGGYTTASSYTGDMDDFRYWTHARTQAEIQAWMNLEAGVSGDAVVMSNSTPANSGMPPSATDEVFLNLEAMAFNTAQDLSSITVSKLAASTVADTAIDTIKLVHDLNDNGVVDTTDTVLDSGTLLSGQVTFTIAPALAITTANPERLLVAVSYTGPLAIASELGFEIATSSDITWSGGQDFTSYPIQSPLRAVALAGTMTISQTGPADFTDVGDAFDMLEQMGIGGPVILEIIDSSIYTSTSAYTLGVDSAFSANTPVAGASATNTITLRAASGQSPVIEGNASGAGLRNLSGRGGLAIMQSFTIVEGLEVRGGPEFGIIVQGNGSISLSPTDITIRRCTAHSIPNGPGIAYMGQNSAFADNVIIENNFVWDCFMTDSATGSVLLSSTIGSITVRNPRNGTIVRHNTILHTTNITAATGGYASTYSSGGYIPPAYNNNIVVVAGSGNALYAQLAALVPGESGVPAAEINYNYWFGASTFCNQTSFATFQDWTNSGRDADGGDSDPMLESTTGTIDLRLQAGSPCVDPANNPSTVPDDIEGKPRPVGASNDIGAFELGQVFQVVVGQDPRDPVTANETGGGDGFSAATFTVGNNDFTGMELQSLDVRVNGTGDDSTAFSEVALYRDDDSNDQYDGPLTDVLIDSATGFTVDDGVITFDFAAGPERTFGTNDTRRYFIVIKLSGSPQPTHSFDFIVEDAVFGGTAVGIGGVPSSTMPGVEIEAATFNVSGTVGSHDLLRYDEQGPGNNGAEVATFNITADAFTGSSAVLDGIVIEGSGTGDITMAYSEVSVYAEDGTTVNEYNFGEDVLVQTHTSGFPTGGELTFSYTSPRTFTPSEDLQFYVVVKLASTANPGETFDFQVTDINVTNTYKTGLPAALMAGFEIDAPTLTVTAVLGSSLQVWNDDEGPGNNGVEATDFDIGSDSVSGGILNSVTVEASGTGDDSAAFVFVALYEEDGTSTGYQSNEDILVESHSGGFPSDDGMLTFTYSTPRVFAASEDVTFYIVVSMAGTAVSGETFNFLVDDISTTTAFIAGVPSSPMLGVDIRRPTFTFTDNSPQQTVEVFPGASDVLIQAFEVDYADGPVQTLNLINIRGTGTGHEVNHLTSVRLVLDNNGNAQLDAGDTVLANDTYSLDNGSISFDLSAEPPFSPPETRHYLVLYDLGTSAPHGATFGSYMQFAQAQLPDSDLPINVPSVLGTAGVEVLANVLDVDLLGPTTPIAVGADDTGPTNDGLLIADVTLTPPVGYSWTVTEMTFVATGSGPNATAFSELALYRDDGNGDWDGAAVDDIAAATASGFNAGTDDVTFNVSLPNLTANSTARFFLVGKLNGNASSGDTFNARLDSIVAGSTTAGQITGLPTADSDALIIDAAALTVTRGPNTPNGFLRKAGTAAQLLLGHMRMVATNDDIDVNSITLTAAGTGDWASSVDASSGVQLWLDNGDSSFDSGTDTLLAEQGGGATITLAPTTPLTVTKGGEADLWIVVNILDTAGGGASDAADTFSLELLGSGDVSASGGAAVIISRALPPATAQMRILDFFVTSFTPLEDIETGGEVITIQGSGLIAPFVVRIDGQLVSGAAQYSGDGTQVTGLIVPPGMGTDLQIEVSGGGLPAEIHTELFTYLPPPPPPSDDDGGDDGDSGCASGSSPWLPAGMLIVAGFALHRMRRRHA